MSYPRVAPATELRRQIPRFAAVFGIATAWVLSVVTTAAVASFSDAEASVGAIAQPTEGDTELNSLLGWLACEDNRFVAGRDLVQGDLWANAATDGDPWSLRGTTHYDWLTNDLGAGKRYRFADPRQFALLYRYVEPKVERPKDRSLFLRSFSPKRFSLFPELGWHLGEPENESEGRVVQLWATRPEMLSVVRQRTCAPWAKPRTVVVSSWGSNYDRLPLVDCDGSIATLALDRISILARLPGVENPGLPLPAEPSPSTEWPDEWVDGVRLLHPRLLWLLQSLGETFPRRTIQIMSGYRRDLKATSPHRRGRALDIQVTGVDNTTLFAYCRSLKDVGCGYYPYHPFVHVDVRAASGKAVFWVDASAPGEPSTYVDAWPGVIGSGALEGAGSE